MSSPVVKQQCLANCTKALSNAARIGERLQTVCMCCRKTAPAEETPAAEEPPAEVEVILSEEAVPDEEPDVPASSAVKTPFCLRWLPKNWKTLLGPFSPLFGGYTIEQVGGSCLIPEWVLFAYRVIWTITLISLLGWASAMKEPVPITVLAIQIIGASLLSASSALAAKNVKFDILADIAVPVYQTLASVALFDLPLLIWVVMVSDIFHTTPTDRLALYVVCAVVPAAMFLIDALVLGSKPQFRVQIIWIPVLVEYLSVFIPVGILTASGMRGPALAAILFYTVLWSIGSALMAVIVTRVHSAEPLCSLVDGQLCQPVTGSGRNSIAELAATCEMQQV